MPERPADLDVVASLERAEYTRKPVDILIRVGRLAGADGTVVADFVGFLLDDKGVEELGQV